MMTPPSESYHRPESAEAALTQTGSNPARPPSRRRAKQPAASSTERVGGAADVILLGCGPAAHESFWPAFQTLQQAGAINLHAVVDPSERAREGWREKFPQALSIASFETVVAPPDALVVISTPTRFHALQSNAALKRGWHVLCANPFANTVREGAQMVGTAERHERFLAIDLRHRFFPAARYLRTLCRDHLLGPPVSFRIHEGTTRTPPEGGLPAAEKFESPDGVLSELGVPTLDLLTWCLGSASVKNYSDDAMGGVEANAFIELAFAEGVHGTIHLSRDWSTDRSYTFVFERGIVRWIASRPRRLTLHLGSAPSAVEGDLVAPLSAAKAHPSAHLPTTTEEAAVAQIRNVLGAIAGRETLRTPATEAMHSLSIVEECYARRTQLPQPWLSHAEAVQARACAPPMALRRP